MASVVGADIERRIELLGGLAPAQRDNILFVLCGAAGAAVDKAMADLLGPGRVLPVPHPADSRVRGRHRRAS